MKILINLLLITTICFAAGGHIKNRKETRSSFKQTDLVPYDYDYHKIGSMWMRVTNFAMIGDDAYQNRTPSADWPGGSGNSYLYRGSLWLTGTRNGIRATSSQEEKEYTPLALVEKETILNGLGEHTWTKFTESIKTNDAHYPLGLDITQHTYAYGMNFADDFILYRYYLKNVGVDTTGDGVADDKNALYGVHFTFRMDGDISKLTTWDTEADFVNRDDHAMSFVDNWDELSLFPYMEYQLEQDTSLQSFLDSYVADSTLTIMFDGDNRGYPSEVDTSVINKNTLSGAYLYQNPEDDFGNPNPVGVYQTPGILAMQMIKTDPLLQPKSYTTSYIGQDYSDDNAMWSNAIGKTTYDKLFTLPPFQGGGVKEGDYRAISTFGPLDSLAYGDSIEVVFAVGLGANTEHAGVYSFVSLLENMDVAKALVADNYEADMIEIPPSSDLHIGAVLDENNSFKGVDISWDPVNSMSHSNFTGFLLAKFKERTVAGLPIYDTLVVLSKDDAVAILESTGENIISVFDDNVEFGLDYTYTLFIKGYSDKYFNIELTSSDFITATGKAVVSNLDEILVVPNPYRASAPWNNASPSSSSKWKDRLFFINLPSDAIIRIFTLDGDHVDTIQPTDLRNIENAPETNDATAEWDLVSRSDREIAPGVYMYHVSSASGEKTGKFVIIK